MAGGAEAVAASSQEAGPDVHATASPPAAASPSLPEGQPANGASTAAHASDPEVQPSPWSEHPPQQLAGRRELQGAASEGPPAHGLEEAADPEQAAAGAAAPLAAQQPPDTVPQQAPDDRTAAAAAAAGALASPTAAAPAEQQQPEPAADSPRPSGAADHGSVPGSPSARAAAPSEPAGGGGDALLDAPSLQRLVGQLREALAERERQIERKGEEAAQLATVAAALQKRNEELVQGKDGEAVAELQR